MNTHDERPTPTPSFRSVVKRLKTSALLVVTSLMSVACALLGGVKVDALGQSVQKPSNVAVYLSVARDDESAVGLSEDAFKIYENGQPLKNSEIKLTLLPRETAAAYHTTLLVDMSRTLSDDQVNHFAKNLDFLVKRIQQTQSVSVHAFDGSERLSLLAKFPQSRVAEPEVSDFQPLKDFKSTDPSSSLHSAVVAGLKTLDSELKQLNKPIKAGSLIVLARGPDLAGRATADDVYDALADTPHNTLLIAVGDWPEKTGLDGFQEARLLRAPSMLAIQSSFAKAANILDDIHHGHYLLSYCSPARNGMRDFTIEVTVRSKDGKEDLGVYDGSFDATGFGPNCDPRSPPRFAVGLGQATPPPSKPKPAAKPQPEPEPESEPAPEPPPQTQPAPAPAPARASPPEEENEEPDIVPPPDDSDYAP